ncbi:hypothetical protein [Parerythrobacter jejuensis]|uniref:Secreted protein n=1 Tax=Parerythrobacter jejuensis TaxID=795812 RepID=A0A845AUM2_9SPHN|nr:hypothetical protein [Parerythrobacter jejuensis]MXP32765.1 hypothetical protein [Parerythrobacter jejuensis]
MKPSVALLFALAVLFLVSQMVGEDSQISDIAQLDDDRLRSASATIGNMDGFTEEGDLGLLPKEKETDRASDDRAKAKKKAKPGRNARAAQQAANTGWAEQGQFGSGTVIQPFDPSGTGAGGDDDDDDESAPASSKPRVVKVSDATEPE